MTGSAWSVRRYVTMGLFIFAAVVGGFGGWATIAELRGAIVASGRIEVDQNRQVVQHLYGGVVAEVLADEGDHVSAGDLLIRLDPEDLRSELAIVEGQLFEGIARRDRLTAERDNLEIITFSPELADPKYIDLVEGQQRLFDARRENAQQQIDQMKKRADQINDQIVGINAQQDSLKIQLDLIAEELASQQSLLERGLAQAARVLSLEREEANLKGREGELTATVAQAEGRITEIELGILNIETTRREEAITQLRDLQPQEIELRERRQTLQGRLDRLEIRAPVSGTIYGQQVFSSAAVIQPAEPLMYIVPEDRPLVITAQVQPRDIDQMHLDQEVTLRFSAFDQRRTPELYGHVSNVSADAFTDQNSGMSFYRVEVMMNEGEAARLPDGMNLIPGMPVEAFIRTEARTPMQFLLKPLMDHIARAFREN